jgi:type I restriction enzyme R subunit
VSYPESIKGNLHAQAFYGVILAILDDAKLNLDNEIVAQISKEITNIVESHDTVDWQTNIDIHNKIAQDIDDMFFDLEKEQGIKLDFDVIDKVIENIITVSLRRFK